jgi:hypothetical protein
MRADLAAKSLTLTKCELPVVCLPSANTPSSAFSFAKAVREDELRISRANCPLPNTGGRPRSRIWGRVVVSYNRYFHHCLHSLSITQRNGDDVVNADALRSGVNSNGAAFERFEAEFPINLALKYAANLRSLTRLKLDAGKDDQYPFIPEATSRFSDRLRVLGVPHEMELYNGDHRKRLWGKNGRIMTDVLPYFSETLKH